MDFLEVEKEAGHARAKAEADLALSLPAEYRDQKNDTKAEYIMHSAQPAAERRWSNRRKNTQAARGLWSQFVMRCLLYEIWEVTS